MRRHSEWVTSRLPTRYCNLGSMYKCQVKYNEAIVYFERALGIYEKAFEMNHINIATILNSLGHIYDYQRNYDKAMACFERALRIYIKEYVRI